MSLPDEQPGASGGPGLTTADPIEVVHPIEAESYRRLAERVDLSHLGPLGRAVVARVIHASADLEYATTMVVDESAAAAGVAALAGGVPVITDTEMVRHGVSGRLGAQCFLDQVEPGPSDGLSGVTRCARAITLAAGRYPKGAVVVIGCAPTALAEVLRLATQATFEPVLVIGLPVGFVGAAQAKQALLASGLPAIANVGDKGGSAVAAAAVNALARLAARGARG